MELKTLQGLSLSDKIPRTERLIQEWYEAFNGEVYVSFSGGKDSTVLLDLVRRSYPEVPAVFADTGLEYPEIRSFVKTIENVKWLRPKKTFFEVINTYGYPVVSKTVSRYVEDLRSGINNEATKKLRLTGYNSKGRHSPSMKLPAKWLYLVDAPFKTSNRCCDVLKKEPMHRYEKETGQKPITGTMASESSLRTVAWKRNGCNAFNRGVSAPLSFWTEQDIWLYIRQRGLAYSDIYDKGEVRTGCMFCMFGVHLDKGENRFQRMRKTHPKHYDYCMETLGIRKVLEYLKVEY